MLSEAQRTSTPRPAWKAAAIRAMSAPVRSLVIGETIVPSWRASLKSTSAARVRCLRLRSTVRSVLSLVRNHKQTGIWGLLHGGGHRASGVSGQFDRGATQPGRLMRQNGCSAGSANTSSPSSFLAPSARTHAVASAMLSTMMSRCICCGMTGLGQVGGR